MVRLPLGEKGRDVVAEVVNAVVCMLETDEAKSVLTPSETYGITGQDAVLIGDVE